MKDFRHGWIQELNYIPCPSVSPCPPSPEFFTTGLAHDMPSWALPGGGRRVLSAHPGWSRPTTPSIKPAPSGTPRAWPALPRGEFPLTRDLQSRSDGRGWHQPQLLPAKTRLPQG